MPPKRLKSSAPPALPRGWRVLKLYMCGRILFYQAVFPLPADPAVAAIRSSRRAAAGV
jgi:hypothetical protein